MKFIFPETSNEFFPERWVRKYGTSNDVIFYEDKSPERNLIDPFDFKIDGSTQKEW